MARIQVGDNRRFLVTSLGEPFFWLADSAWDLLSTMSREDVDYYLRIRAAQRFTVIQVAAVTTRAVGQLRPDVYGHQALSEGGLSQPQDEYFTHLDYVIARAAAHSMYVAVQPWRETPHAMGELLHDPGTVLAFATWLARRYREQPVVWLVAQGTDAPSRALVGSLIQVLRTQGGERQLIARLPLASAGAALAGDEALDLVMRSCGPVCASVWRGEVLAQDAALHPPADTAAADGGAAAVDRGAAAVDRGAAALSAPDAGGIAHAVRWGGYADVFAGACGFSFVDGRLWSASEAAGGSPPTPWREALFHTAAEDMQFLRQLVESRPYLCRIPDQNIIIAAAQQTCATLRATRGADGPSGSTGSYAFVYSRDGRPVTVALTKLTGTLIMASWFDPRTGVSTWLGQFAVRGQRAFVPPSQEDWVLVLEDSARHFQQLGFGSDRRSNS